MNKNKEPNMVINGKPIYSKLGLWDYKRIKEELEKIEKEENEV